MYIIYPQRWIGNFIWITLSLNSKEPYRSYNLPILKLLIHLWRFMLKIRFFDHIYQYSRTPRTYKSGHSNGHCHCQSKLWNEFVCQVDVTSVSRVEVTFCKHVLYRKKNCIKMSYSLYLTRSSIMFLKYRFPKISYSLLTALYTTATIRQPKRVKRVFFGF